MNENDKEWMEEQERVDQVVDEINNKIEKLSDREGGLKEGVIDIRKNFWEDVTVNLDEMDDVIETQASLKQQAEFLSERERSYGQVNEHLKTLYRLEDSPYFGRIDFKEDGEAYEEPIYIGISSLMDENDDDFLIYDWRAPISSLYYDYPPGEAEYETIDGTIEGEITLKRQFIIRNGKLKGMFNTGLTIGDHLLQAVLGGNADTNMKSIVATIQREQNQIIRNEKSNLLIVQGVAGSGKTSAALQRVAYLLYRYREVLNSENIVLFSPNPLFNSYVATVLPELGEENMQQTTFSDYVNGQLDKQFTIESPFDQMEYYLNGTGKNYDTRVEAIRFKASLEYKRMIDTFVNKLEQKGVVFTNITFRGQTLVTKEEIESYFYGLDASMAIPNRIEAVSEWLLTKLKQFARKEKNQDWVLDEIQLLDKEDYLKVHQQLQEENPFSEDTFDDFDREEELLRRKVIANKLKPLRQKVKLFYFVDVKNTFIKLFLDQELADIYSQQLPLNWDAICKRTIEYIKNNQLTWEDATPYLYFKKLLTGFQSNLSIQHVFIDEAQDYSPFQFAYLKRLFPNSRMTLLGDISQAIYAHALHEETLLSDKMKEKHEKITLRRSYRSTKQIVDFTKSFMPEGDQIEPFNRDGVKPVLTEVGNYEILYEKLVEQIEDMEERGHQTIAVICKTMRESTIVYRNLQHRLDVKLMNHDTHTFSKGIVVIPAYLAKGIEFDAVIIHNASEQLYNRDLERNLFYTAGTRAMHELKMFSLGKPSPFIEQVPNDYYTHYKIYEVNKGQ
ncbi:RNA polymerase recycling motor HelD [Aquibacillus sediminis]|uniref:RNA polymerase recycling motor HelD n=1 Tax=Aquibacillus sediminis TaxID=2574734 RepID=UPI0011089E0F|nr:RNA polymerase recycling motor HelD [Aquibacillus sediminis]